MPHGAHTTPVIATPLTDREVRILRLMCEGVPMKRIARELGFSRAAGLSYHVAKLYRKSGCTTQAQLGAWAALKGFVYAERWAVPAAHHAHTTAGQSSARLGADVSPTYRQGSGQAQSAAPRGEK